MLRLGKKITTSEIVHQYHQLYAGFFCNLAVLSLKQMANRKFTLSSATKRKLDWLKAQWVNETCRDLNRALQDLFPDSYRLLFTTGSFNSIASPFSNEPTSLVFNENAGKDRNLLVLVEY